MMPAASVSGFYLAHPDSHILQRRASIGEDQVQDQAARRGADVGELQPPAGAQSVRLRRSLRPG